MITQDNIALQLCYQHACAYEAWVEGPVPLGQDEQLVVHVDCIIMPTREAAEECVWAHIMRLCDESNYTFDPEDWTIMQMRLNNGN